jgi:hypothetical protein
MVGGKKGFENNKKLNNFWVKPSSVKIAQQVGTGFDTAYLG